MVMKAGYLAAALLILIASCLAWAVQKPNFGGVWIMDRARSFGMPGDMHQTMTIKHDKETIELVTKIVTPKGETAVTDGYIVDGQERDFTPQGNTGPIPNSKGKRKANWLPNGRGIVVEEVFTVESENGVTTNHLTRKWTISNEGELIIDLYYDVPSGSFETKRIFRKE